MVQYAMADTKLFFQRNSRDNQKEIKKTDDVYEHSKKRRGLLEL